MIKDKALYFNVTSMKTKKPKAVHGALAQALKDMQQVCESVVGGKAKL